MQSGHCAVPHFGLTHPVRGLSQAPYPQPWPWQWLSLHPPHSGVQSCNFLCLLAPWYQWSGWCGQGRSQLEHDCPCPESPMGRGHYSHVYHSSHLGQYTTNYICILAPLFRAPVGCSLGSLDSPAPPSSTPLWGPALRWWGPLASACYQLQWSQCCQGSSDGPDELLGGLQGWSHVIPVICLGSLCLWTYTVVPGIYLGLLCRHGSLARCTLYG